MLCHLRRQPSRYPWKRPFLLQDGREKTPVLFCAPKSISTKLVVVEPRSVSRSIFAAIDRHHRPFRQTAYSEYFFGLSRSAIQHATLDKIIARPTLLTPSHRLVLDTLTPLPTSRKCFRMINGVLVERTVGDVLPQLQSNADNMNKVLVELAKQYKTKQDDMEKWKVRSKVFLFSPLSRLALIQ